MSTEQFANAGPTINAETHDESGTASQRSARTVARSARTARSGARRRRMAGLATATALVVGLLFTASSPASALVFGPDIRSAGHTIATCWTNSFAVYYDIGLNNKTRYGGYRIQIRDAQRNGGWTVAVPWTAVYLGGTVNSVATGSFQDGFTVSRNSAYELRVDYAFWNGSKYEYASETLTSYQQRLGYYNGTTPSRYCSI